MTRGSLRLRLLLAGALSILAALLLAGFGLMLVFERHVERRVAVELYVYLDEIVAGIDRSSDGTFQIAQAPAEPRFAKPLSGLYWQVQIGGTYLRSRSLWDARLVLPPDEVPTGAVLRYHIAGPGDTRLIAVERRVVLPPRLGGSAAQTVVAVDASDITAATNAFALDLLPYLIVLAVFLIAAAYAQVAIGLRPLATVAQRLSAIRNGQARRLGKGFPDEIVPLASEVDDLLAAREAQIEKARTRAGDLAHGLKTPLQVLAGDVERLRMKGETEIAAGIEQVATSMRRHVDRELARTRMASGNREAVAKIAEIVERVVAVVTRTPSGGKRDWSVKIAHSQRGRIDPDDLAEAIGNLVENAARHARKNVSISSRANGGCFVITVSDDGPGIPPERLDEMLRRGGQLDSQTGGTGLGLAIVDDIAQAWGGSFTLRTGAAGLEADFAVPAIP